MKKFGVTNIAVPYDAVSPKISPDGTKILWLRGDTVNWYPYKLRVASITGAVLAYQRKRFPQSVPFEYQIYSTNGSNVHTQFTNSGIELTTDEVRHANWHPNSTKIIFTSSDLSKIETINSDGTNRTVILDSGDATLYWQPQYNYDGTLISFWVGYVPSVLYTANANGSSLVQVSTPNNSVSQVVQSWANATNKLAYSKSLVPYVVNSDGTGNTFLDGNNVGAFSTHSWYSDDSAVVTAANDQLRKMPVNGSAGTVLKASNVLDGSFGGAPKIIGSRIYYLEDINPPETVLTSLRSCSLTGTDDREEVSTDMYSRLLSQDNY